MGDAVAHQPPLLSSAVCKKMPQLLGSQEASKRSCSLAFQVQTLEPREPNSRIARALKRQKFLQVTASAPRFQGQSRVEQVARSMEASQDYRQRVQTFQSFVRARSSGIQEITKFDNAFCIFLNHFFEGYDIGQGNCQDRGRLCRDGSWILERRVLLPQCLLSFSVCEEARAGSAVRAVSQLSEILISLKAGRTARDAGRGSMLQGLCLGKHACCHAAGDAAWCWRHARGAAAPAGGRAARCGPTYAQPLGLVGCFLHWDPDPSLAVAKRRVAKKKKRQPLPAGVQRLAEPDPGDPRLDEHAMPELEPGKAPGRKTTSSTQ